MAERIKVIIDAEGKNLGKEAAKAVAAIGTVKTAADQANASQERQNATTRAGAKDTDSLRVSVNELDNAIVRVNRNLTFGRNILGAMKFPVYAAGAGLLARELNAVAAGLIAVGSAGAPAVGVLATIPQIVTAAAQAVGTIKLATNGVTDAVKAQTQAQVQAGASAQASATQQSVAAERVRTARQHLQDTTRGAETAERSLTASFAQARLELQQLQQAAEQTALSERQAEITLRSAIQRRRELSSAPGTSLIDLDQSNVDVDAARAQLEEIRRTGRQQQAEIARTRARGTNRSDVVVKARENAAQADREVADAKREVAQAERDAAAATDDLTSAQSKAKETMDALPESAQRWVTFLVSQQGKLKELRKSAADGLFPGLEAGAKDALKNFDVIDHAVERTSSVFGDLAEDAGKLVGSKAFGKDLGRIADENATIIDRGGHAALNLSEALVDIIIAAEPLTDWLSRLTLEASKGIEKWAETGRETGKAGDFFEQTREVLEELGGIVGDVAEGVLNIGKAAYPTGRDLLSMFHDVTTRWSAWTDSMEGRNELRAYFEDSKSTIVETGRLVDAVVDQFLELGSNDGTARLLAQMRTELVPAIGELLDNLSGPGGFGEAFISTLTQVVDLFASLSDSDGGLTLALEVLGKIVEGVTWLIDQGGPGLKQALGIGLAGLTLYKVLGIGQAISGVTTLIGLLKKTKGGAGAAGAVADAIATGSPITWTRGPGGAMVAGRGAGAVGTVAAGAGGTVAGGGAVAGAGRALPLIGRAAGIGAGGALGAAVAIPLALIALEPKLDKLTGTFDQLIDAPRGSARFNELAKLEEQMAAAVKAGDPAKLHAIAAQIDAIGKATGGVNAGAWADLAKQLDAFGESKAWGKVKTELKAAEDRFASLASVGENKLTNIRQVTEINMHQIAGTLGKDSQQGKEALAANFRLAAQAVKQAMDDGKVSTKTGLHEIQKLMRQALEEYGFTPKQAANIRDTGDPDANKGREGGSSGAMAPSTFTPQTRPHAVGGWIGDPGARGRDDIPILVGEGEAILNADQQGWAELGLQVANSMGMSPYSGLDSLFRGETSPHYMGFASGGRAGGRPPGIVPIPGMPGEFISQSILGDVERLMSQYHARVTDGWAPTGHKAGGEHPKGLAVDLVPGAGGSWDMIDRLAAWAEPKQNQPRRPFRWVGYNGDPGHGRGDHLHLSWLAGQHVKGGGDGGSISDVARVLWKGPGGALGALGQTGLDTARAAANDVVARAAGLTGTTVGISGVGSGGPGGGAPKMGEGALRAVIRDALRRTGHYSKANENALYRRVMQESGGDPGIVNTTDSNAKKGTPSIGLAQVIGPTFAAYRDKKLPNNLRDPLANLVAAINYMYGRYGRIVDANGQGYKRGGKVRRAAGGKKPKRVKSKAAPPARPIKGVLPVSRGDFVVPQLGNAATWADLASDTNTGYGLLVRSNARTEEQSTRTAKVSALTDDELLTVYTADDLPKLRANPDQQVEIIDRAAIAQHVAELQAERAAKDHVRQLVKAQSAALSDAIRVLTAGIAQRTQALQVMRDRLAANIKRIAALKARLKRRQGDVVSIQHKLNARGLSKADRARLEAQLADARKDVKGTQGEIDDLTGADIKLSSRIDKAEPDLAKWTSAQADAAPALHGLQISDLPSLDLDVGEIDDQIRQWGATPNVEKVTINQAPNDAARADLLQSLLDESRRANFLQTQQITALTGFQPLLAGRVLGSFAHGSLRVPYSGLYELHGDEQVIPDPEGPYGSQNARSTGSGSGGGATFILQLDGDLSAVLKKATATTDDGRTARVTSRLVGRQTRLVIAAPG